MTRQNRAAVELSTIAVDLMVTVILMEALMASKSCVIGRHLADLTEPYRSALAQLIASETSADEVAVILADVGLKGSASAIRIHRRGQCVCRTRGA